MKKLPKTLRFVFRVFIFWTHFSANFNCCQNNITTSWAITRS